MPTATEDEKVAITGILADKTMIVKVEIGKNHTIGEAVGKLGLGVAQIISNRYNLQPRGTTKPIQHALIILSSW